MKRWLCDVWLGPFCWPMPATGIAVFGTINLLGILLRCNGFTEIQKAAVDQMGSRLPNSDHGPVLIQVWPGKCFEAISQSIYWTGCHQLSYKIHCLSQFTIPLRNGLLLHKRWWHFKMIILICSQLMRHPRIKLFHLSSLLQLPSNHRMVNVEFFSNFSWVVRGSALMILAVGRCQLLIASHALLIFKALISFAKHLDHLCTNVFVSNSWATYVVDIVLSLLLYDTFWIRKLPKLAFCLTSFP